jgi:hypothetical protein
MLAALLFLSITGASAASLGELKLVRELRLHGDLGHVQGVDTDGRTIWVTSVDSKKREGRLFAFGARDGVLLNSMPLQEGERFHPGGFSADGDSLWIPVAEYRANSSAVIQRRSKRTLALESEFPVTDHIGCLAATPEFLIGGNWDSREFYVWNRKGELLRKVASTTGNAYQDMKYWEGSLIASGVLLSDRSGAIDRLALPAFELRARMSAGKTPRGAAYTREGMAVYRGDLLFLPEDGPDSTLFMFRGAARWLAGR